jgi:hypothetical protein
VNVNGQNRIGLFALSASLFCLTIRFLTFDLASETVGEFEEMLFDYGDKFFQVEAQAQEEEEVGSD